MAAGSGSEGARDFLAPGGLHGARAVPRSLWVACRRRATDVPDVKN